MLHHTNTPISGVFQGVFLTTTAWPKKNTPSCVPHMPLTDTAIRQAKPTEKAYKLTDGGGLFLLVQPTGSKLWRMKYRFDGKEKLLALGAYPDTTLAAARKAHAAAREKLAANIDPGQAKKEAKRAARVAAENSFEAVARAWWKSWKADRTEGTASAALRALELHVFPYIGKRPFASVEPAEILDLLRRLEARSLTDTLKRVRGRISEIYIYGIASGLAKSNPAEGLHKAVRPHKEEHRPALRSADLRDFFIRLDAVRISLPVKLALRLLVLTFVRPGELRCAQWPEFDLDAAIWTVPAKRDPSRKLTGMKMRREHTVPLSTQAVELLRQVKDLSAGNDLLFPNRNGQGRPMSDGTINSALRAMGYRPDEVTGSGFRATATGALLELGFRPDVIDRQLAHRQEREVFAAYSHQAQFMAERRAMMQAWADHIDAMQPGTMTAPHGIQLNR